jgi:hypothetical protein
VRRRRARDPSRLKALVNHEQFALRGRARSLAYLDDGQFAVC